MSTPKRTRLLFVVSLTDFSITFLALLGGIDPARYDLRVLLLNPNDSRLEQELRTMGMHVTRLAYSGGKLGLLRCMLQSLWYMLRWRPQVVHANLFDAGLATIPAAWLLGIRRRLYTRHYATLHLDFYPNGIKWDKLLNRLSTHILSISPNVTETLVKREGVLPHKTIFTPHGFDLAAFQQIDPARLAVLRDKHVPQGAGPVIGVVARFTWLKGIQHIIPAFAKLQQHYPNALLLLFNAAGDDEEKIKALLQQHCPHHHRTVRFEQDVQALFHLFDVYVHVPIDPSCEAFGQTYIEALAAGIPSIFTLSGIASEFIHHKENAWVVPYEDSDAIYEGMHTLLTEPALRQKLIANGRASVANFTIANMVARTQAAYESQ